jgi:protein-tyrosine kinase
MKTDASDFAPGGEDPKPGKSSADARQLVRQPRELVKEEPEQLVAFRQEHDLRSGGAAAELRSQQYYYPFTSQSASVQALGEELVAAREPFSDRAEEFRSLRSALLAPVFSSVDKPALAVVSAERGHGKTYLVANLAISFSQFTGRTLLIDANLRQPALQRLLKTEGEAGLSNLLAGEVNHEAVVPVDGLPGLHFLGARSATADPMRLLQGPRFSILLEQMVDRFDYVFIDTPSNDAGPDARLIAARAGAALVVGRKGHSRVHLMRRFLSQLSMGPSLVAGVVLNQH